MVELNKGQQWKLGSCYGEEMNEEIVEIEQLDEGVYARFVGENSPYEKFFDKSVERFKKECIFIK